jgi:uncharacterized membrane protein
MRTSVELEGPIVERPVEEVFAFVGNLENSPRWGRTRKSVKDPDSPDGVGAVFREETRILGEKVKSQSEVTRLDPPTEFSYTNRFENGVIEETRIVFAAVDGDTRIDVATEVDIDRFPQVLAPFFSLVVKQRISGRFNKLEQEFKPPDRSVKGAALLIAVGAVLLATAGMRYLIDILPEGEWRTVLALVASALVASGAAFITWKASRRGLAEDETDPAEPHASS